MHRLVGLVAFVGCSSYQPDVTVVNRGEACVYAWPAGLDVESEDLEGYEWVLLEDWSFAPNEPALIRVAMRVSGCAMDVVTECSVSLEGTRLVLTNFASWNEPEMCLSRELKSAISVCRSPKLETGTYSAKLADALSAFQVPSELPSPPCLETPP